MISLRNFAYFGISFKAFEKGIFNSNFLKVFINLSNLYSSSFIFLCLKGKGNLRAYFDVSTMEGCSTCFPFKSSDFFFVGSTCTSSILTSGCSFSSSTFDGKHWGSCSSLPLLKVITLTCPFELTSVMLGRWRWALVVTTFGSWPSWSSMLWIDEEWCLNI